MQLRRFALAALAVVTVASAEVPAFADEWGWHDRRNWREHEWRQHEWRERMWREHEWREHHLPPVYGYYAPPPAYYGGPIYYR